MFSALIAPALTFIAFLLLLLVSLSAPIIKSIYLLSLAVNVNSSLLDSGANASVRVGVWGYCVSSINISTFGHDSSTAAQCSKPHLGYKIDQTIAKALNIDELTTFVSRTLTAALVLHPVACGLAFLALLTSLGMIRRSPNGVSRLFSIFTVGTGFLAALITTVIFIIDIALVAIARNKLNDDDDISGDLNFTWGNAVWMTLGATIALWVAVVGACIGICACGGRYRKQRIPKTY